MTDRENSPDAQSSRYRVLLVDDEPGILRSLKRTLRRAGHEIILAEGGAAGIKALEEEAVHLVICDQRMPDVPGPEVLAKAYDLQPDAFRITLTGHTDLEAAQKSINEGHVNQFLMKPWDDEHLRRCVEHGLRSYQLVVENRELQEITQKQNKQLEELNAKLEEKVEQRTVQLRKHNELLGKVNTAMGESLRDTVRLLSSMLEMWNPSLGLHGKRVASVAKRIGEWLELDEKSIREIEFAALLHEIGLVGAKPEFIAAYCDASTSEMRKTADSGYRILSSIFGFRPIAEGVRDYAKRYDGLGSKSGESGDSLSIISRVIAVADAYDTAVFNRLDPTKVDRAAGRQALEAGRRNRLDPDICELLLRNLRDESTQANEREVVEVTPRQIREGMVLVEDLINSQNVLLAKAGTRLNKDMVERVRRLCPTELLTNKIMIYCEDARQAA